MAKTNEKNNTDTILENGSYPDPLNTFLFNAIIEGATDVHLHAIDDVTLILYRVDGVVHEKQRLSVDDGRRLINQIKAAAGLNVTKSFFPQEAQIRWLDEDQQHKDFRVTVVPVGDEECAHLRILSMPEKELEMTRLGFSDEHNANIAEILNSLNGLILITGVTGSGKTTTMYSMASSMALQTLVAFSIEDPVEFKLPSGQQLEVDEEHGLTMYEGLRTILRMDPDFVMVGEIRDKDSAIVTARAALSGRLVLGTIHGQDAAGVVDALHYLGVPYYITSSSLRMIIAQKLLRKLCLSCAKPRELYTEERDVFARTELPIPEEVFDPVGCEKCNGYGYKGQIGIFETAIITPEAAHKIALGVHNELLRQYFRDSGIAPMTVDGLTKVADGITSMQELFEKCNFPDLPTKSQSGTRKSIMI